MSSKYYLVVVHHIEFDLDDGDLHNQTIPCPKRQWNNILNQEFANKRFYHVEAGDEGDACEQLIKRVSNDSGWPVSMIDYAIV